jgi:membrane AbrB-like protein
VIGWVEGGPPRWLVDAMQLIVGLTLGVRFAGRSPRLVLSALGISVVSTGALMVLAGAVALALPPFVGESWQAVFLAFAPGGLAEMSLVALSMEISAIYVTLHHVARILIAVTIAQFLADRIIGR